MFIPLNHIIFKQNDCWLSEPVIKQFLPDISLGYLATKARYEYRSKLPASQRKKDFLPKIDAAWRYGKKDGIIYYDYYSIPNKAPNNYRDRLPNLFKLQELYAQSRLQDVLNPMENDLQEALKVKNSLYNSIYECSNTELKKQLCNAAAVIYELYIAFVNNKYNLKPSKFFASAAELIVRLEVSYLPKHPKSIKSMVMQLVAGKAIKEVVKVKREGNINAAEFSNDEEVISWIFNLRKSGKNFTNAHIIRKVQWLCSIADKPIPSPRWIGTQMQAANIKFLTEQERFGGGRYAYNSKAFTPFATALNAGDCWQIDGTRLNLVNFKSKVTIIDEATGKERTLNKETFATVVAVRDVHSGEVLGKSYDLSENRWVYIDALKNAVDRANYLPFEIVFDRFPGYNTPEFEAFAEDLRNRGVRVTFTHAAEGKARLERWFGTLQTVFMQDSEYYYGEGILSNRKFAHRSKPYLQKLRKKAAAEGWNFDKVCEEGDRILNAYNNTAYSYYSRKYAHEKRTPIQIHNESETPNVMPIKTDSYYYLFGLKRKLKMANMGLIKFEMNHANYSYRCANYQVISNFNEVIISYMPEDMSVIHLYQVGNSSFKKYLGTADLIPDIVPFGPNAFDGYGKQQAIIKSLEAQRQQEIQQKLAVGYDVMSMLDMGGVNKQTFDTATDAATINLITGGNADNNEDDISFDDYDFTNQL